MKEQKGDRRTRRTKKLYEDAFIELLKTKELNKITVTDLSEALDMNRGTFYIHYSDIYDLLDSIEANIIAELTTIAVDSREDGAGSIYKADFERILKALEYIERRRDVFKALLNDQGHLLFLPRIKKIFSEKLLITMHGLSVGLDEKYYNLLSSFFISGAIGVLQEWLVNDSGISVFELATVIEMMLKVDAAGLSKARS